MNKHREPGRSRSPIIAAVWIGMLAITPGLSAQTSVPPSPKHAGSAKTTLSPKLEAERKRYLALILETKNSISDWLQSCADGKEVGRVKDSRASGDEIIPDASETCPLVIEHAVDDGSILDYYRKLVAAGNGNSTPEQVLKNTAVAAMNNQSVVAIGNGKGFKLTDSQAFTAGNATGASDTGVTLQSLGLPPDSASNEDRIDATADACLDGRNPNPLPASACFTAGLVRAVLNRHAAASAARKNNPSRSQPAN